MTSSGELRSQIEKEAMFRWVDSLAPWKVFATHTFLWKGGERVRGVKDSWETRPVSLMGASKIYERFMSKRCGQVTYFYAVEKNPGEPGHHIHALWADCEAVQRSIVWSRWKETYGRNRIEPVKSQEDVASYCSKYVTKRGAWWNFKIVSPELWRNATGKGSGVIPARNSATVIGLPA